MESTGFIEKATWIHIVDGHILCTLSKGKEIYYLPGGKKDAGESDRQALLREIKEELTVDLLPETVEPFGVFEAPAHGDPQGRQVRMTCWPAQYRGRLTPAAEILRTAWLTYGDKAKCSEVVGIIFDRLHDQGLIGD